MNIYFIRHGETEYNTLNISQGEDTGLSDVGLEQSKQLAKRSLKIPIDMIYSSPMKRAEQTAGIINGKLNKEIIYSDSLKERRAPSEFVGKRKDDVKLIEIEKLRVLHEQDPLWHYSDEENYFEYKQRVEKFFDTLANTKEENVLVISHGGPIRMLIFLMMEDGNDPEAFCRFSDLFRLDNTGITFCKRSKEGIYSVQVFNDRSHLG